MIVLSRNTVPISPVCISIFPEPYLQFFIRVSYKLQLWNMGCSYPRSGSLHRKIWSIYFYGLLSASCVTKGCRYQAWTRQLLFFLCNQFAAESLLYLLPYKKFSMFLGFHDIKSFSEICFIEWFGWILQEQTPTRHYERREKHTFF